MFFRKASKLEVPAQSIPKPSADEGALLDDALDATANILRALGTEAFPVGDEDVSKIAEAFERWAQHVLVATPLDGSDPPPGDGPMRRDWRRLVHNVADHRRNERRFVETTTREAREAIWALVDGVGKRCADHGRDHKRVHVQAARLRDAVEKDSFAELKREATVFADTVVQILEEQKARLALQAQELSQRLETLETQLVEARREGGTDPLTKLANRRIFDAELDRQTTFASVVGRPLSLIMIDIDHFKGINDQYGHPAGDRVLREMGDRLVRAFPRRTDVVARFGGEEFACILPDTPLPSARVLAERFGDLVRTRPFEVGNERRIRITASAGLAVYEAGEEPCDFIARADRRLYTAKQAGRDRAVDDDSPVSVVRRASSVRSAVR